MTKIHAIDAISTMALGHMALKGVTLFGGMVEGWNGGTEWRNTRNILKYGTHGISKTRKILNILKRGIYGIF